MLSPHVHDFLSGTVVAGYAVIGLFFLRFWSKSRDRLFVWFAVSFWILAAERLLRFIFGEAEAPTVYLPRLAAFLLIILAILEKNRSRAGRRD